LLARSSIDYSGSIGLSSSSKSSVFVSNFNFLLFLIMKGCLMLYRRFPWVLFSADSSKLCEWFLTINASFFRYGAMLGSGFASILMDWMMFFLGDWFLDSKENLLILIPLAIYDYFWVKFCCSFSPPKLISSGKMSPSTFYSEFSTGLTKILKPLFASSSYVSSV
jgi:hypothetical protein